MDPDWRFRNTDRATCRTNQSNASGAFERATCLQAVAYLGWLHSRILYAPESGAVSLPRNELEAPASLCHRHLAATAIASS